MGVSQNGQKVSEAGAMADNRVFNDGSLGNLSKCTKRRIAPTGPQMRNAQSKVSGVTGSVNDKILSPIRIRRPAHLKKGLVLGLACGSLLQAVQYQCFQSPTGRTGIQKMCPTSK